MPDDIGKKVEYVKRQGQTRNHTCHWPSCNEQVPPALWSCRKHWYALPKYLRDKIWNAYQIGQEIKGNPSDEYIDVMREVHRWLKMNGHA